MKNLIHFLFFFFCLSSSVFGQGPERKVFASAGKVAKCQTIGSTNTVSYTIGETIVNWSNAGSRRIHNGFQQPDQLIPISPSTTAMMIVDPTFLIYPNPFSNHTIIEGAEEQKGLTKIQLIDQNGKLIQEELMIDARHDMDFETNLAPGQYFLNFYNESGAFLQQTKIIKIATN